jgi:hypothetical protein
MNRGAAPGPMVKAFPLGDSGFALVGAGLAVNPDPVTGDLVVSVVCVGGRMSEIVGLTPVQVELAQIARIPLADVVKALVDKEDENARATMGALLPQATG